jgi:hypothetical protein
MTDSASHGWAHSRKDTKRAKIEARPAQPLAALAAKVLRQNIYVSEQIAYSAVTSAKREAFLTRGSPRPIKDKQK